MTKSTSNPVQILKYSLNLNTDPTMTHLVVEQNAAAGTEVIDASSFISEVAEGFATSAVPLDSLTVSLLSQSDTITSLWTSSYKI